MSDDTGDYALKEKGRNGHFSGQSLQTSAKSRWIYIWLMSCLTKQVTLNIIQLFKSKYLILWNKSKKKKKIVLFCSAFNISVI